MGFVYKARQPGLDRVVALKVLPQRLAGEPGFRERFTREGRMLARLGHPSIVNVFDFGESGDFFYLLMEYVDGVNLRQAMRAGRFTLAQALTVVPKICEALSYAHGEGVLHRDIKPENILLDTRGRVKIADFGIAKLLGEADGHLTAANAQLGTPHYMAPEQIERPSEVDHRADIYSLGVVFYEMLTGELPLGHFAPPSEKSPLDPRIDYVVMRALARERERRQQSAGEIKTQVENLAEEAPEATVNPATQWSVRCLTCRNQTTLEEVGLRPSAVSLGKRVLINCRTARNSAGQQLNGEAQPRRRRLREAPCDPRRTRNGPAGQLRLLCSLFRPGLSLSSESV
jgi:serine/threonine protein kinase